jgi:hypothetical protein
VIEEYWNSSILCKILPRSLQYLHLTDSDYTVRTERLKKALKELLERKYECVPNRATLVLEGSFCDEDGNWRAGAKAKVMRDLRELYELGKKVSVEVVAVNDSGEWNDSSHGCGIEDMEEL